MSARLISIPSQFVLSPLVFHRFGTYFATGYVSHLLVGNATRELAPLAPRSTPWKWIFMVAGLGFLRFIDRQASLFSRETIGERGDPGKGGQVSFKLSRNDPDAAKLNIDV